MTDTEHRVVWHYTDGEHEPVAETSWTEAEYPYATFDRDALKSAGREGVGLWAEGEPLEDASALYVGSGYGARNLDVTYLDGASLAGGASRSVAYRIETREASDDE